METTDICNRTEITLNKVKAPEDEKNLLSKHQEQQKDDVLHNTDDMFTVIGLGRWHFLPILVSFLYFAASPAQIISSVFTNMPLDFKLVSILNNKTTYYNTCAAMDHTHLNISSCNIEFDHTGFKSTFTSEFGLLCDKAWISNLYQVSLIIGLSIGSLLGGIGDKWGRLIVIRFGAIGCLIGVLLVGFGPNVYLILVGRLITGLFCNILNVSSFTLAIENTPTHSRSNICLIIMLAYNLSVILIGTLSYFLQHWRELHLTISCYIYLIVILSFFLDKSPRWLLQNGQFKEAITLLEKIIKLHHLNNREIYFAPLINEWREKHELKEIHQKKKINPCIQLKETTTIFFRNPAMICISLNTPIIWFITGLVYFGVPLNAHNFTNNPYIYMVLIGVVEVVSIILGRMVLAKFGNIRICAVLFAITGSCLLLILIVSERVWWLKWILILIAMMSISLCYTIGYIMVPELYPTQVRATGLGICTFFCFMGFILSSILSETTARYSNWVFNVVCSAFCFIAVVIMIIFLPETKGEPLCETADDVAERSKRLRNKT